MDKWQPCIRVHIHTLSCALVVQTVALGGQKNVMSVYVTQDFNVKNLTVHWKHQLLTKLNRKLLRFCILMV